MIAEIFALILLVATVYQTMKRNDDAKKYDAAKAKAYDAYRQAGVFADAVKSGVEHGNLLSPATLTSMGKDAGDVLDTLEALGPGVAEIVSDIRGAVKP